MRHLLLFALALAACSPETEGAPLKSPPCTFAAGASGAADLVVVGAGSCAGTTTFHLRVATGDPAAPVWSDAASSPVRVHGAWRTEGGALVRSVEVENTSGGDVALVGLEWSADPLGITADRFLHQGYQSWTYTGVEAIPDAVDEALGTARPGGDGEHAIAEQAGVSWWVGAAMNERGQGLVVGADGGTVLPTFVAADARRLRVVQGLRGDAVPLASGQRRALDGLFLALGDAAAELDAYAAHVARRHPPAIPRRPALGGWGSWNRYYADIDATKLREEASWAAATLAPLGLTTLLLDDGYEPRWGAWEASPSFGAELGALNAEQVALGLSPAVWLAPIYVDVEDSLVVEHPDWFVKKPSGELRTFTNFGPTYAALDVTRAEARAHVADAITRYRDLGYRAIKIDFLFGAAISGQRSAELTGLESYQRWMSVIREAAGELHVIGCGAPILPSVSWVDSMRTGPDVAFVTSPEATWAFVASQARHTALRAFTDAWWSLDPDVVLLRGTKLSDAEAWTFVVSSALAGGNWLSGDGRQAPAARLSMMLAPEILALSRDGHAARPVELAASMDAGPVGSPLLLGQAEVAVPHVWKKAGAVAVFGWEADPYSTRLELPPGARELVAEGGAVVARPAPSGAITVARHAARLFIE
jgi:alpha-galactosidase